MKRREWKKEWLFRKFKKKEWNKIKIEIKFKMKEWKGENVKKCIKCWKKWSDKKRTKNSRVNEKYNE